MSDDQALVCARLWESIVCAPDATARKIAVYTACRYAAEYRHPLTDRLIERILDLVRKEAVR